MLHCFLYNFIEQLLLLRSEFAQAALQRSIEEFIKMPPPFHERYSEHPEKFFLSTSVPVKLHMNSFVFLSLVVNNPHPEFGI
jgi:hypothetical protein